MFNEYRPLINKLLKNDNNDPVIDVDANIANLTPVEHEQLFELMKRYSDTLDRSYPNLHIFDLLKKGRVDQARDVFFSSLKDI
jgi:hypothetical protein